MNLEGSKGFLLIKPEALNWKSKLKIVSLQAES
jgi:hypothetical protein